VTITPAPPIYSPYSILPVGDISSLLSTASLQEQLATLGGGSSTVVDLSGFGQLLSATDLFQSSLSNLQPGSTASGIGENFGTNLASLAAEAQSFVDAYNTLQDNLTNLQESFGSLAGNSLVAQLAQALNAQVVEPIGNSNSAFTDLGQIGIEFQPASTTSGGGTLSLDLQTLQSAFETNPTAAFSLLAQATQALGNTASGFTSQAAGQLPFLASGLWGNSSYAYSNWLALSSLNSGSATTLTQQLMALNEFNLVSSLLA
jgi:hypothetical protein